MAMLPSSSSSSSITYAFTYDVFISFRGSDTRYGFTGNLYKALTEKGIHTFIDDEELQKGEKITPSLEKAIEKSRIFIVVLSKDYASSSFCLDELSKILDCSQEERRLVWPVFYDVDPFDVRKQTGTFGEAMVLHTERFKDNKDKLQKWRTALQRVANFSGWHFKHGNEYEHNFIEKIVEEVSKKIKRVALYVAAYPVGLESPVLNVISLLDLGSHDRVHLVGIHGTGGIGKTTLALAVYNSIADHFQSLCFLKDVRETSKNRGILHLQEILLSDVFGETKIKLTSVEQGISTIQRSLRQKKILLILDDVDKKEQLQHIVGRPDLLGPGSRVIITTRDQQLLACYGVGRTYKVEELKKEHATELFTWKAFKNQGVDSRYEDLLNQALSYASGLPLALEVISSNLFGKTKEEWESALEQYRSIPPKGIKKILKVSFDALDEIEKNVFLDIACCFKGYELAEVEDILCAHHDQDVKYSIEILVEKSLISITPDGRVTLHPLIEQMGKEIVQQESPREPGKRSRLWFIKDIVHVLENNMGTREIKIIHLDFPLTEEVEIKWDGEAFKKMKKLKTLIIKNCHFSKAPIYLPNSLRVLEWWRYPSEELPSDFHAKKLAILKPAKLLKNAEWLFKGVQHQRGITAGRSSSSSSFTYDMFLGFTGSDTLYSFTQNLDKALLVRGIHTFIHNWELEVGDEITPAIVKAIEESKIAIPVLSENSAFSSFCLDELVYMIECVKAKGLLVLPVFYGVYPSDVRYQRGIYGKAFSKHEESFEDNREKVQKWRNALQQAANLSGYHFKHGDEDERAFIKRIVKVVSSKIIHLPLHVADYPVGLESRVREVISLLDVGSDDGVHMVGIYGIGGIGKTTLARAVYNTIAGQFGGLCFLENVKNVSSEHGLIHLQQKLIFDILGEEGNHIRSVSEGISIINHRLHQKKILLILDDVDKFEQLEAMVGGSDWIGFGSKVIITTRDKHLLATHGVERTYEVKKLNEKDALELLSWNAFKTDKFGPSYGNILNLAINFAFRIPLALEVIGSNFFGMSIEEWEAEFNQHAITLDKEIQDMAQEESSRQPGNLSRVWFANEWTYDIFLSFSGLDTRTGFIGYLYNALVEKGICSFIGDVELQRGEKITLGTREEIEESRIAIVVLSKCYVSSSYCLDELANIIECIQGKGRLVLPIFYDVDPSDILHERGSCGEALFNHERKFKDNQVKVIKWRTTLLQTANLSGWHIKQGGGYEYEFIEKIVEDISRKINRVPLHVADHPIGLRSRVLEVKSILDVGFDDGVLMVGIHGICGIGKTAIVRGVYNLIADHFESLCFLENVKKKSNKHGLVHLQEIFLSKVVGEQKIKLVSVKQGISIIKHRLQRKKVLLVLDDVDKPEQVEVTAGGSDWFGAGSRIIITTRDKQLLASHGVERIYEVKELNRKEAFQLLSWKGFRTNKFAPSYKEIVDSAVTHASGLPFALELMGSNLFGKSIEECESSFTGYETMPAKGIPDILRVSFDGLGEVEKNIYLDIACFFEGYELAVIENILCAHYGVDIKYGIRVLAEKSLIKINQDGKVTLHDLMQDMGRQIVFQESPEEPGQRSRLWFFEDIVHVLEENTGTNKTQIIILEFPLFKEEVVKWDGEAFKKMQDLKTLIIRNGCFSKGPNHLPNSLRVLEWEGYPSQSLPSDFHPEKLAIFKLASNCFISLELLNLHKKFMNLRVLGIKECESITQIPDFSGLPNLEKLSFVYCENLIKIHESVGFLNKLRILDMEGCCKIRTFPPMKLTSLTELYLSHCSNLKSFPEILAKMENITLISVHHTPIKELPSSIGNLTRLRRLQLHGCGMLLLPSDIAMLPELEELSVWQCEGLQFNQDECEEKVSSNLKHLDFLACNISDEILRIGLAWFANVRELDLSVNNFTFLPACFKDCFFLRKLTVDYCMHLQEIRGIPPNLETFSAKRCTSLNDIDLTVHLAGIKRNSFVRELIVDDCENLREIIGISPYIELLSATNCTSLTSLCSSMLLNQELHEAGNKRFCLPGTRIPRWFEHRARGPSISFWFRNEFPAFLSLCLVGLVHMHPVKFSLMMIINGNKMRTEFLTEKWFSFEVLVGTDHMLIFGEKQIKFKDSLDDVLLENEWNHVVVSIDIDLTLNPAVLSVIQTGLHVLKQSSMEDIRFSDPYDHPFLKVKHSGGVS